MTIYYTDGSCDPNPGAGGFAVIKNMEVCALGHEPNTTNIRMEGRALIAALQDVIRDAAAGQTDQVTIYTDSEFWINVITKWSLAWERNGWKKKNGQIKNLDLVQQVCPLYRQAHATLAWVRGHNKDAGNELADQWANKARQDRLRQGATG